MKFDKLYLSRDFDGRFNLSNVFLRDEGGLYRKTKSEGWWEYSFMKDFETTTYLKYIDEKLLESFECGTQVRLSDEVTEFIQKAALL